VTLEGTELKESKLLPEIHIEGDIVIEYDGQKRERREKQHRLYILYIVFYVSLKNFVDMLPCSCDRNYHVFYYLLAGSTPELKTALDLTEPSDYLYLSQVSDFWLVTGE